ncbi:N-6 DNA methylase [Rhizobium lusitanum]|uniref:N-6 DNA methylase n=1 Tax=Rhizobium lusitanum TaxID=293958 RepID=A0A6L9UA82_9HYPH|nr:N-6 DNA methylase [Rhizobium lusitanum]NEI71020.1 N-6 DNA methylase [Rhizobium lusitanum]
MSNPHLQSIIKLFESLRYRHDLYGVFSDWCECAAISLSNAIDLNTREKREQRYMDIVKRYERHELEVFPQILGEVVMALETAPQDILGSTFHALELHNKARGQFFTPYELCRLMAQLQVSGKEPEAIIKERGFLTAHEPAVGAGATVIALAEALMDAGVNYQQHLHVVAVDVDPRAVHMSYVQFSLMHIPAHVIVGDTLRMTFSEDWYTPAHIMGGWSRKLRSAQLKAPTVVDAPPLETPDIEAEPPAKIGLPLFDFGL